MVMAMAETGGKQCQWYFWILMEPIFSRACQLLFPFAWAVHLSRVTGEEGTLQKLSQESLPPKHDPKRAVLSTTCSGQSLIFLVQDGQTSEGWDGNEESLAVFLLTHSFLSRMISNVRTRMIYKYVWL